MTTLEIEAADNRRPARRSDIWRLPPALLVLAVVVVVPLSWAIWLSVSDVDASGGRIWVGLDHYIAVLGSSAWWTTIATTATVTVALTLVQLMLALAFAVALWHVTLFWWPARFLALVPAGVGVIVGAHAGRTAVEGGFLATWFGIDSGSSQAALAGVLLGELWRTTGLVVVLLHVALSRVPTPLLDASVADGATAWQRWWRVIWPVLTPALIGIAVYRLLDSWRLLEGPLLVRQPGDFETTASAVIADTAFWTFQTGPAAAAGVTLVLLAALLAAVLLGVAKAVRLR